MEGNPAALGDRCGRRAWFPVEPHPGGGSSPAGAPDGANLKVEVKTADPLANQGRRDMAAVHVWRPPPRARTLQP
jgi:hypothetical protein